MCSRGTIDSCCACRMSTIPVLPFLWKRQFWPFHFWRFFSKCVEYFTTHFLHTSTTANSISIYKWTHTWQLYLSCYAFFPEHLDLLCLVLERLHLLVCKWQCWLLMEKRRISRLVLLYLAPYNNWVLSQDTPVKSKIFKCWT